MIKKSGMANKIYIDKMNIKACIDTVQRKTNKSRKGKILKNSKLMMFNLIFYLM